MAWTYEHLAAAGVEKADVVLGKAGDGELRNTHRLHSSTKEQLELSAISQRVSFNFFWDTLYIYIVCLFIEITKLCTMLNGKSKVTLFGETCDYSKPNIQSKYSQRRRQ